MVEDCDFGGGREGVYTIRKVHTFPLTIHRCRLGGDIAAASLYLVGGAINDLSVTGGGSTSLILTGFMGTAKDIYGLEFGPAPDSFVDLLQADIGGPTSFVNLLVDDEGGGSSGTVSKGV